MAEVFHMQCCGVREINELSDMALNPRGAINFLADVIADLTDHDQVYDSDTGDYDDVETLRIPAFMIFTQAGTSTKPANSSDGPYGDYFTEFIASEKLGTVHVSEPRPNPNTGNLVTVYLWTIDQDALKNWSASEAMQRLVKRKEKVA